MGNPDRYEPMPGLLELPGWLLAKLPRWARVAIVGSLAVGTAAAIALVVGVFQPAKERRERAERAVEGRLLDARLREVRAAQRPHRVALPAGARRDPLRARRALERAIAVFARTREARCRPRPNGPDGALVCDAVRRRVGAAVLTVPFWARIDAAGRAAFCRKVFRNGVPDVRELASYRIAPACGGP